jgi:hypothetical protein
MELAAVCDPVRELAQKFADSTAPLQGSALHNADPCRPHGYHHVNAIAASSLMRRKPLSRVIRRDAG